MLRLSEGRKAYPSGSSSSSPFPPGVLPPFPEPLSALYLKASFSWPSRLIWALLNSPVARARSFSPFTLLARVNSAAEAAPFLLTMPTEKMARSSSFTFLPSRISSLVQAIMSVSTPLINPAE